jgi:RimJ/RimL family protein N-acetyltransferase
MIKGKTITIQILERRHLDDLRRMRNDPAIGMFLTTVRPVNEVAQEEWFRKMSLDDSRMYFAIVAGDGCFVGVIRCDEWDKANRSIRIGVDIAPGYRRKGYATEAYRLLIRHLFCEMGLHRVWLLVAAFNKPAIALYRKLGFTSEGAQRQAIYRNGQFNDYVMLGMLDTDPAPAARGCK